MVCYEIVFPVVVYVKKDFALAQLWDAVAFSRDDMAWLIKTGKTQHGLLASFPLSTCSSVSEHRVLILFL